MTRFTRRSAMGAIGAAATLPVLARPALAQDKLTVGALRFTSHAASFVAFERGYFAQEGLEVEFRFFEAAQPMAIAIASGDADYAVSAISGGLISLAEKGAARVIGGALSEEKGIDGQKILASNAAYDAGLVSPATLDGKSFGITQAGSSFHYMGARIAATEGADITFKPLQKVGAVIGALKSGQIDAWSVVPHIAKPLAAAGAARIIGNVADYLPDYQVTTVFTSARNAENERAKTESFLRAFARGADDFNAALVDKSAGDDAAEDMVRLIHKYVYTDRDYDKARPAIVNGAMRINKDGALNMGSVEDQLGWFRSEGLIKDTITTETLVDPSYVDII
ncbi:NitT/TauT family transport system substrate-binding protein [Rhodovulum bhavnagarense]|uniref:NitT/TauT family transport system substrate-binding protein n=1 Tax=Rhodovulum bhavnagarense TaxID=992286 RepID=A0A4R2RM67_9RHOB|nr:ABC transporter substrate-binding protein [Rhodovulum bhavnagarense]TCP63357.1 NitT/TauT family transport system substrate-binding protein [Rhodovulum bhavnagarense]